MKLKTGTVYIHYDFPVIFSATNEEGNIFICLFANETNSCLRYLCREVSSSLFADLENNKKDIRSIFENSEKLYSITLNAQSEEPIEAVETTEDISSFLPDKDLFIGNREGGTSKPIDIPSYSYATA
ncbi:MAG: hypothetical protein FWB86_00480 [Treponema sp.]|nr:hypothetical protein [Treponema sp.]MCL2252185.1 hypothetical protein [Treponema sp.]